MERPRPLDQPAGVKAVSQSSVPFREPGNVDYPLEKARNKGEARDDLALNGERKFIGLFLRIKETEHLCRQGRVSGKKGTESGDNH